MRVRARLVDSIDGRTCLIEYGSLGVPAGWTAEQIGRVVSRIKASWTIGVYSCDHWRSKAMALKLGQPVEAYLLPWNIDGNWILLTSLTVNGVETIGGP